MADYGEEGALGIYLWKEGKHQGDNDQTQEQAPLILCELPMLGPTPVQIRYIHTTMGTERYCKQKTFDEEEGEAVCPKENNL